MKKKIIKEYKELEQMVTHHTNEINKELSLEFSNLSEKCHEIFNDIKYEAGEYYNEKTEYISSKINDMRHKISKLTK